MPTLNACDFAYPPTSITIEAFYQRLYALGVRTVQRYLWHGGKGVTLREIAAAKNAGPGGISIDYGYEGYASNWRGGAAQGVKDAAAANAIADELGLPGGVPIYYAVDEDAHGLGMLDTAVAYVHAANTPKHPARPYGQYAVVEALKLPAFQTYAWPPRNPDGSYQFGAVSKYTVLYQWHNNQALAGGTVDYCETRDGIGDRTVYSDAHIDAIVKALNDQLANHWAHIEGMISRLGKIDDTLRTVSTQFDGFTADFRQFHANMFDHLRGLQVQINNLAPPAAVEPAPHPTPTPKG